MPPHTSQSVQRHLVIPAQLSDACDGFLRGSLGGELARMAAEQGDFNVVWHYGRQFVDIE